MIKDYLRYTASAAAAVLLSFCQPHEVDRSGIKIANGARTVTSTRGFEQNGVEYTLAGADANAVVQWLAEELAESHWTPVSPLWDNTENPSSFVVGWYCYPEQSQLTYQWIGDWRNDADDIVTYIIKTPDHNLQHAQLQVLVSMFHPTKIPNLVRPVAGEQPAAAMSTQCRGVLSTLPAAAH